MILLIISSQIAFSQASTDINAYYNGEVSVYNSKGHTKAKGLEFSINYLTSWDKQEGNRPHIVQKFTKEIGTMRIEYLVSIGLNEGEKLTDREILETYNNPNELIPKEATLISSNPSLKIDGEPACLLEYKITRTAQQTAAEMPIEVYSYLYLIVYNNYTITIVFSVAGIPNGSKVKEIYNDYKPFFRLIANSFIINSKWN